MSRPAGSFKLATATPQQLRRLAESPQWVIAPDLIDALKDPRTLARQKVDHLDRTLAPGSITLAVGVDMPKGYILPLGPIAVPPSAIAARVRQARPRKEVRLRAIATLLILVLAAIGIAAIVWAFVVYVLTRFPVPGG